MPDWSPPRVRRSASARTQRPDGADDRRAPQAWAKGLEAWGKMLGGVTRLRRRRRRTQGPPLRRARMEREPDLRHHPPKLSGDLRQAARHRSRRSRGSTPQTRQKLRFATKSFVDAMSPSQFRADQPAGDEADDRDQGRESAQGPRQHARRHRRGAADADQAGRVRGRPQPGDDAGQGDPRDAALPADPVHADDRRGAGDAGGDLPAVDQPLLHPRPHAREKLRQMVRRPGRHPVHGQLEIGRREHRRRRASTIMC